VVLTIAGSSLVTIPLNLVGTAAHQALLRILRWPLLYLALLLPLPVPIATAEPQPSQMAVGRRVTWGNAIAGALAWWDRWRCPGTCQTSETITPPTARSLLAGAEINAEMEHQTARDTTSDVEKPMGHRGARMADDVKIER
jgi:membrane protein